MAQRLFPPGGLDYELAVAEHAATDALTQPHVGHLRKRHHLDVGEKQAGNQHQPVLGDDEVPPPPDGNLPALSYKQQTPQQPADQEEPAAATRG
jgi:hypothetical protein